MFRLLLFVLLAYFVWRVLESFLRLIGKDSSPKGTVRKSSQAPRKPQQPPFRDIRDAEFEDLTPHKDDDKPTPPES